MPKICQHVVNVKYRCTSGSQIAFVWKGTDQHTHAGAGVWPGSGTSDTPLKCSIRCASACFLDKHLDRPPTTPCPLCLLRIVKRLSEHIRNEKNTKLACVNDSEPRAERVATQPLQKYSAANQCCQQKNRGNSRLGLRPKKDFAGKSCPGVQRCFNDSLMFTPKLRFDGKFFPGAQIADIKVVKRTGNPVLPSYWY